MTTRPGGLRGAAPWPRRNGAKSGELPAVEWEEEVALVEVVVSPVMEEVAVSTTSSGLPSPLLQP